MEPRSQQDRHHGLFRRRRISQIGRDGYNPQTDEVYDALQSIRLVRAHAKEWNLDPNKIGIMGFSAGAELVRSDVTVTIPRPTRCTMPSSPFAWCALTPRNGTSIPTRSASWAFPPAPN